MRTIFSNRLKAIVSMAAMLNFVACEENDEPVPVIPTVISGSVTNITTDNAEGSGVITSDGGSPIIDAGLVWSYDNQMPDTTSNKVSVSVATGSFTGTISNITVNSTYYVRAFAKNAVGIAYGSSISFNTLEDTSKVTFEYGGSRVSYGVIVSPASGRKWLDRNLGASRAAASINDAQAYGDLVQFGRLVDGHQVRTPNPVTTTAFSSTDVPGHGNFVLSNNDPWDVSKRWFDWRKPSNNDLWQGDNGINNTCPDGWHVPTKVEWEAENFSSDGTVPYTNLKLVIAGRRRGGAGNIDDVKEGTLLGAGYYWSATTISFPGEVLPYVDAKSWFLIMSIARGCYYSHADKADGLSVRCIKNN